MKIIIKGGTIFQENATFTEKDIQIENGRILCITEPESIVENSGIDIIKEVTDEIVIDASNLYVLPGFIDIHSHGAVGHDFSDGDLDGLKEILSYQYAHGVTSYCPTTMTLPKEKLLEIFRQFGDWVESEELLKMSRIVGLNMEGPFLDSAKKGAHKEEDILTPDVDFFQKCNEVCGNRICLVTVAPNTAGALDFIREVKKDGAVTVSLGHTDADYDTTKEAFNAGASHVTHLFNAMTPMNHRNPGLIGAAAENESCMAELICDGVHVHESMVRAAFKLFPGRIVLISDSMRAAGLSDGNYDLGGQQVNVRGNLATLADGTIAGSVTNLFDCMKKAIEFGIPAEEAVAAATMNPAKSIGIYGEVGSLTCGKRADVILVDKNWNLVKVI